MRWVRKERKEALPVVDTSLQNPQPECVRPANFRFLSSIVYLVKTPEKCRSVILLTHLVKAATTQSANEDVCDSTIEPGFGAASSSSVTEMIFGLFIPTF